MKISDYVKNLRKQTGLSQARFAREVDSNRSAIANYENDRAIPPGDVLLRIQAFESSLMSPQKLKSHNTLIQKIKNFLGVILPKPN